MNIEGQAEVVAFLESPAAHGGLPVERVDTHASIIFLAGERAWKLKRAVRYDYLDFSTPERRRAMCEAELRINQRTAPELYCRVVPVTREATGGLAVGGSGTAIDWVIEMVRFDQEALLDRLAERNALDAAMVPLLASAVARFHRGAERRRDHGGRNGMSWVVEGNALGFSEQGRGVLDAAECEDLTRRSRAEVDRYGAILDHRRDAGFVRHCHGDLHLRNIVMIKGSPTIFDAIEFNDEIACIDVFYDVAFLLMDLCHRGLVVHANRLLNGYLAETHDFDGLGPLPLFLSCRAAINAKTRTTAAALQPNAGQRREAAVAAQEYLRLAAAFLCRDPPRVIAIGGFSGSGKSTLAMGLAPLIGTIPGAVVIRSDEIRKQLFRVDPLVKLGASAYTPDVSRAVYDIAAARAALAIRRGRSVIVDAVFADPGERRAIEKVAKATGVPFAGLWLDAPTETLIRRAGRRRADASDADALVIEAQIRHRAGPIEWRRVDASESGDRVLAAVADTVVPVAAGVRDGVGGER